LQKWDAPIYFLIYPIQTANIIESWGLFQAVRYFRLILALVLIPILYKLAYSVKNYQFKHLFVLSSPIFALWLVNIFQLIALPSSLARTHLTGSIKFTAIFLAFQYTIFALKIGNAEKFVKILSLLLLIVYLGIILQYPILAIQSGVNPAKLLASFGQIGSRLQLAGFFGSANEDAHAATTLLPIALFFVGKSRGYKLKFLTVSLLILHFFALLYNGSRSPLVITLPILLILYFTKFSIKNLIVFLTGLPVFISVGYIFNTLVLSQAFASESATEGTFGWRVEQVWKPALEYTTTHSLFFGFGSRGWEHVSVSALWISQGENGLVSPHNTFIWSYVSWGLLGLASLILFLIILLSYALQSSNVSDPETARLGKALFCSVCGYIIWSLVANSHFDQGWIVLTTLASLIAALRIYTYGLVKKTRSFYGIFPDSIGYVRLKNPYL
jgi:hypothetical protein